MMQLSFPLPTSPRDALEQNPLDGREGKPVGNMSGEFRPVVDYSVVDQGRLRAYPDRKSLFRGERERLGNPSDGPSWDSDSDGSLRGSSHNLLL